ncbi:hypothetical protein MU852_04195 [Brevundimonas albigilva]|uniref:hypothetical protein n=1 Tax=Brevundimonas albigilva TaxID=1312364 RepID=UPI00201B717E|nr:hypothetical protein [Brevundimonas albigilva]UQV19072.1 hypothetical protein MU852_04195 [Brevundimonas albigilva]
MKALDLALRGSAAIAALAFAGVAVVGAFALTIRTEPAGLGVVYRENVLTGRAEFCSAAYGCKPVVRQRFPGRLVQ